MKGDQHESPATVWSIVKSLITGDQLLETEHGGQKFYKRGFPEQFMGNKGMTCQWIELNVET